MICLLLHDDIYSRSSIEFACRAYSDIAEISLKDCGDHTELVFADCLYDVDKTVKEFENYLINTENALK